MSDDLERRFPRRLLLGGGAAAAALAAVEAIRPAPAAAAPVTSPWLLGGNDNVLTDGTNWLGTKNAAPVIFKTGRASGAPVERLRIATTGRVGVGTTAPTAALDVVSKATSSSDSAIVGRATAAGSATTGVTGSSTGGIGVAGSGAAYGVTGAAGASGFGLYGSGAYGGYGSGSSYGLYGIGPVGVRGYSSSDRGVTAYGPSAGVYSTSDSYPLWGDGGQFSVYGTNGGTAGVKGLGPYVGVWGDGTTYGVYGRASGATGETYGVFGSVASTAGYAVVANGNARVYGTLAKNAGSFQIDHPLDPENKWLSHSFVESPDMMNVYNGNVVLGAGGKATVELPDYFSALNRDHRYQLTCIGGFAPVYVSREVQDGTFEIAGGTKGLKVSWQVTGIRQDDYARDHPIVVEQDKTAAERGSRIHRSKGATGRMWPPEPTNPTGLPARPAPRPEPVPPR